MVLCRPKSSPLLKTSQFSLLTCCFNEAPVDRLGQQVRHASLIRRPYRPYTFTQLVVLSDGSTFTIRTTSPAPVYKSNKDSRNHPLWQPSSDALRNVETDEAGRLSAFRKRFGTSWDAEEKEPVPQKNTSNIKIRTRSGRSNDVSVMDSSKGEQMRLELATKSVEAESLMKMISNAATSSVSTTVMSESKEKKVIQKDPGKKLITSRNVLGKGVQIKVKNLEHFQNDQKSTKSGSS